MSFNPTPEQIAEHDRRNRNIWCPFYATSLVQPFIAGAHPYLIESPGSNQCALITSAHSPCVMEVAHFPPIWAACSRNPEVNEARSATTASPALPEGQTRAESREALTAAAEWEERFGKPTPEGEKP